MSFKSKKEFVEFIRHQTGVELSNEESILNKHKKRLYTEIKRINKNLVLAYLNKIGIHYEPHVKDYYWIML